jgi:xanthoxin dehydrogenase
MAGRLDGKVVMVTGGASGIGEATVRLFLEEGARLVIADIQNERGESLARELGAGVVYQKTDVTLEADVEAAVQRGIDDFGRLDCVFANAGIVGGLGTIAELPVDEWDFTMSVNLRGVFLCMKHAARVMKSQGSGCIIATASISAIQGGLGPHAYGAAKAAVIALTHSVAAELAPHGARANCIAASSVATEMIAGMVFGDTEKLAEVEQGLAGASPIPGRAGLPADIAHAALYLASDEAGYVTGHTLVVDAGITTGSAAGMVGLFGEHSPMVREAGRRGLPE